jgi:hypothetical protein
MIHQSRIAELREALKTSEDNDVAWGMIACVAGEFKKFQGIYMKFVKGGQRYVGLIKQMNILPEEKALCEFLWLAEEREGHRLTMIRPFLFEFDQSAFVVQVNDNKIFAFNATSGDSLTIHTDGEQYDVSTIDP